MKPRIAVAVLFVLAIALACSGPEPTAPDTGAVRLNETHTLGEAVVVANLTVWPVFTDRPVDLGEFTTLSEALAAGTAEVREVGGGGGQQGAQSLIIQDENDVIEEVNGEPRAPSEIAEVDGNGDPLPGNDSPANESDDDDIPDIDVPSAAAGLTGYAGGNGVAQLIARTNGTGATVGTLVIENKGDVPLLVCAGTIVKGGNQDRQIGEDIIIAAKKTVPVEAFCVEQGRWTAQRMGNMTAGIFDNAKLYALKPVRLKGQYLKQQDGVWNEVAQTKTKWMQAHRDTQAGATAQNARIVDETTSLAVVLDANREVAGKEIEAIKKQVLAHFAKYGKAVGFAYAVDGKVVTVRAFLNDAVFGKQFDPFLTSMVTEAWLTAQGKKDAPSVAGKAEDVVALVNALENESEKTAQTRGSNLNGVRMNAAGYNGNCYLPVEGRNVAVTRDWTSK